MKENNLLSSISKKNTKSMRIEKGWKHELGADKKGRGSHLTTRVDLQMSQGMEERSGGTVD